MSKHKMKTMSMAIIAVMMLATALSAAQFTITLNQNYTNSPGNMVVQTDDYGCLTGAMNAPLVLPSPTRAGYDFRGWFTSQAATGGTRVLSGANGTFFTANTTIYARWTAKTTRTISDMPAMEKEHFDWVKDVRNVCEPVMQSSSLNAAGNLTFHEIFAGNGSMTWAVRWESDDTVSVQERRRIAAMLYEGINEWLRPLMGYEDWPFGEIPVTVVGWAVQDANLIRDRRPNETIWVNSDHREPKSGYTTGDIASASTARSRFENYRTINNTSGGPHLYRWPDSIGGLNGRFDKYLWLTKKKNNGVVGACGSAEGGDWGFRWGQCGPGSDGSGTAAANAQATNGTINGVMLHEIGHSFGFYDWYGSATGNCAAQDIPRNPPALNGQPAYGNSSRTMMHYTYDTRVSGTSPPRTEPLRQYDEWQIRYYYNWVKEISPASRWNYTPVAWVATPSSSSSALSSSSSEVSSSSGTEAVNISVFVPGVQFFNLNNRGIFSYNLNEAKSANLKVFDSRGKLLKAISLNGTHGTVDTQLGSSMRVLLWRVEDNGRLIDQSKTVIW
ncbi:MAG: InlB B-repeat-containing protein [Fibromonadaceae bacterium]|jgi:uncharacterized repeat protein (TIGR02543 family)|nr:InlB B-repeat-containing protein [Fibromonadaceae bacterium]